ncbi:hypothetical protein SAMN04488128_104229 [Chitinophaga eiseniae]|uniref:Uncharacterized protein n=1 Tax=Chitinophaga eiseniae TaxID=634771 RepID=A0A1T4TA87_9BACT|nr:hypothetical protein SAMN04488128_104229 [Chitinophaga eiseniae]
MVLRVLPGFFFKQIAEVPGRQVNLFRQVLHSHEPLFAGEIVYFLRFLISLRLFQCDGRAAVDQSLKQGSKGPFNSITKLSCLGRAYRIFPGI